MQYPDAGFPPALGSLVDVLAVLGGDSGFVLVVCHVVVVVRTMVVEVGVTVVRTTTRGAGLGG